MTPGFLPCDFCDYALEADTHGQEQLQETMQHVYIGFTWARMHLVSVVCSFDLGLYLDTYKESIDHQNTER